MNHRVTRRDRFPAGDAGELRDEIEVNFPIR